MKEKHCRVIRNGANSLFQTTLREQNQRGEKKKGEFLKVLQLLREKVKSRALTTVSTLLGSSL